MKRTIGTLAPIALVAGLTAGIAAPAQAEERRCTGTIRTASIDGDVVVPAGATCRLLGTSVDGSVKVYRGATAVIKGARVNGNIQAENHRTVRIVSRWASGERRTHVGGSIQLKQGGGGEIRRAIVNADIQLFTNSGRFSVYRNDVGGNLQCKSNDPAPVGNGNIVQGNKEDQCEDM